MDGWMDGWMGGWMDGWVDGWMEAQRWILRYFSFVISQNKTREENMRREAYAKQWGYVLTSMVRALVNQNTVRWPWRGFHSSEGDTGRDM